MRAQILRDYGPTSKFTLEDWKKPTPSQGEVLIKVHASSINPADVKAKELGTLLDFTPHLPAIMGMDVSGIVEEVGPGVDQFLVGDHVMGVAGGVTHRKGSLAEYMVADVNFISKVPSHLNLSFKELASFPLVAITAWNALFDFGQIKKGDKILILGAGGSVGLMAIQLAKSVGAYVVASARKNKMDLAKQAGADQVYSDDKDSLPREEFDLVFDTIGGDHLIHALPFAKKWGKVATTVGITTLDLSLVHEKALTLHVVYMLMPMIHNQRKEEHQAILKQLVDLLEKGKVIPFVEAKDFKLENANDAFSYFTSGKAKKKVVININ